MLIPNLFLEKDKSVIKQEVLRLSRELSYQQLLKELALRGFIKVADKNATTFKTISDDTIVIGESKNNVKITPSAKAYTNEIKEKPTINAEEHVQYYIAGLLPSGSILSDGANKHPVVVYDKGKGIFYLIGYFTSNKASDALAELGTTK